MPASLLPFAISPDDVFLALALTVQVCMAALGVGVTVAFCLHACEAPERYDGDIEAPSGEPPVYPPTHVHT